MAIKIMPISDLRRKTSDVLSEIQEGQDVYITHYGRPVAVLVSYEHYERLQAQVKELRARIKRQTTADDAAGQPITDYTTHLAGLHREVWEGVDTGTYLQEEREAWED
jgi:prevent-host-death family protein